MKKILFLMFVSLFLMNKIEAQCNYKDIARLKSYINNINISYDYRMVDDYPVFDVTINNIIPEIYFTDIYYNKTYTYSDTNNGEIVIKNYRPAEKGTYMFYSSKDDCNDRKLGSKYYTIPPYNPYYKDQLCKDLQNLTICQKWVSVNYSKLEFADKIFKYKQSLLEKKDVEEVYEKTTLDRIFEFYVKNYVRIFLAIILVFGSIVLIERKTNRFKI